MAQASEAERLLVERIKTQDSDAWQELIDRYEGRLLAYVRGRLPRQEQAEDVVQETFVGFLTSLPHYDLSRSLESYLLSIAAHKLTDHLRYEGRRPTIPLTPRGSDDPEMTAASRGASSLFRSRERRHLEERALTRALQEQLVHYRARGDWDKLKCVELLFVRGWANKHVAEALGISEQKVANTKFEFIARLKTLIGRQGLAPEDVLSQEEAAHDKSPQ